MKIRVMGKERIIEIDDRMPCNNKKQLLLPRTVDPFEIWPQLIVKAYFKAYAHKWFLKSTLDESGDGSFVHAVTGLIPEKV